MKKVIIPVLLLALLTGCSGSRKEESGDKINIVVTINPYFLLAKHIAGDKINVDLLIPPGASPHTFAPAPADLKKLEKADLVLVNGMGLEAGLEKKLAQLKDKVIRAEDFVVYKESIAPHEHEHESAEKDKWGRDPHLWLDTDNLIAVGKGLLTELIKLDPEFSDFYIKGFQRMRDGLTAVDNEVKAELEHYNIPGILTFHNSFGWFLDRYNIPLAGVIEESPGKEPSPRMLAETGNIIRTAGLKAIFIEPQLNPKAAEILAGEFNLTILTLDPLGTLPGIDSPEELIRTNWERIKSSLQIKEEN